MHKLAQGILKKNTRALAKAISLVEQEAKEKDEILKELFRETGNAFRIGVTGPPGAGKSSLVNQLISLIRSNNLSVAVVAVDPSSSLSGGSILGDRIRMNNYYEDKEVYIRSISNGGKLGGLFENAIDVVRLLDAYGFDIIILETVGVGQSELEVMKVVDTTCLVLNPNSGDSVQVYKAGIMEIANIFIINKADLPGKGKLKMEIESSMDTLKPKNKWVPPVIETICTSNPLGINTLWNSINDHKKSVELEHDDLKSEMLLEEVLRKLNQKIENYYMGKYKRDLNTKISEVLQGQNAPYSVVESLFHTFKRW
ncbi:methylmalonyl Co-A mutase-associated GTPase MeaB [Sutcliffiella horikoshii]|uniref:methylmalonyl Co-A mutase-associated GTPase MeaB n=1 Tax=Sutcliffiella horikoshii TaxID=79883 RepID=UPI003CE6B1CB